MPAAERATEPTDTAAPCHILGTAGHIDHGKSTLVRALTGVDPDRLPEEKRRGMTIELGFAPLRIGKHLFGIVDVPGHERFVRTMVAGATGIDLAMLLVAADDGVMPQTREHAQILDLLGVTSGVVVISKTDAAAPERIAEVQGQIDALLAGTALERWPRCAVSAARGEGLDALRAELVRRAESLARRRTSSVFRLAIDRVFTVHGRGTVVTGSVLSGRVAEGDTLELLPRGQTVRVREVQSHHEGVGAAALGQRAAINLAGVKKEEIERGWELATPGYLAPTRYFDASLRVLPDLARPVETHTLARLSIGTSEVMAVVVLLEDVRAAPGREVPVQLRPEEPVVCEYGQRFILRQETAAYTIGGGVVLRPVARRGTERTGEAWERLARLRDGEPQERVSEVLRSAAFEPVTDFAVACRAGVEPLEVPRLREALRESGVLVEVGTGGPVLHGEALREMETRATDYLRQWHDRHASEPGFPQDRFMNWLARRTAPEMARALRDHLLGRGRIVQRGAFVCHPAFAPALSGEDQKTLEALLARFESAAMCPPTLGELKKEMGRAFARAERMIEQAEANGQLVRIDADLLLHARCYEEMKQTVRKLIERDGPVTLSAMREALGSTRKFVVPIAEHLDKIRFTRRRGDLRTLAT